MSARERPNERPTAELLAQVQAANRRLDAARQAAMAGRPAALARLAAAVPAALQQRVQWLLWRLEVSAERPGTLVKPAKVPYYVSGSRRAGGIGEPADLHKLATMAVALDRFGRTARWDGIGFTFLAGDGLIGIDLDHAVGPDGAPLELCRLVVEGLASYTELSPSGTGVHVIVAGEGETFKDDRIGVEVYTGARYFTVTGLRCDGAQWPATPAEVQPAEPQMMAYLRELVDESKAVQRAEREQAAALAAAVVDAAQPSPTPTPTPTAAPAPRPVAQAAAGPVDDFKRVNDAGMANLAAWVPALFSEAKASGGGYRVTSKALGRELQEDLSIKPSGIVDFGLSDQGDPREGRRTPVDLVLEWGHRVGVTADKPAEALRWLANVLGVALTPRATRRAVAAAPAPAGRAKVAPGTPKPGEGDLPAGDAAGAAEAGDAAGDGSPEPPLDDGVGGNAVADAVGDAGGADAAAAPSKPKRKVPAETWALVETMCQRFALVYGTDTAWDKVELMLIRVQAMRLAFDKLPVNLWLTRPDRQMVRLADLVFEPGREVAAPQINMFCGLDLVPEPATADEVAPMLDLLRHLCTDTRIDGEANPVDAVMHWILCWQALPLQRVGTKMGTAVVMHGAQGTGKNLYWDAWRDLFGDYGITVGQTELEDKYNGWLSRKLAIVGDEVTTRQEMYHNKNRLKLIVTQEQKFPIRGMFQETRWESNHANVVFTSNENLPLVLEDRDRRYEVVYTPLEADAELYRRVKAFLNAGGLAKWAGYLQAYDVGDFQPHTKPLMTKAKAALIEANWRPSAQFGHEWLEGFIDLPVHVCSAEQLYRAFRGWCDQSGTRWPPDQRTFSAELNRWAKERVHREADGRFSEPALVLKVINLPDELGHRKSVRCWVPDDTGPRNGVREGDWAADSVRSFENALHKFRRQGKPMGDEEPA